MYNPRVKSDDWHTFQGDRYERAHASYDDAVFWAQCSHDTQQRPKREGRGLYSITTRSGTTYIASTEGMKAHGFQFGEDRRRSNPYIFPSRDEKILEWGFVDPWGDVIREPHGNEERIEHEDLAHMALGMSYHEALTEEGYTRLLVSQFKGEKIQAGFKFYAYDTRPLKAIQRYLSRTEIPIEMVEVEAVDTQLDQIVTGGRFYGTPAKAVAWLRQYQPPEDEEPEDDE